MTTEKATIEERLAALEVDALAHMFVLHRTLAALATLAPDPQAAVDLIRSEVDAHFASLRGLDPTEHQDFEQGVENILDNAFGDSGERFMPLAAKARR